MKCRGYNYNGALGIGVIGGGTYRMATLGPDLPAALIGSGRTALALAGYLDNTCVLRDDYTALCWGANQYGQVSGAHVRVTRIPPHACDLILYWSQPLMSRRRLHVDPTSAAPSIPSTAGPGRHDESWI